MNLQDAIKTAQTGVKVKLPEWTGYWFYEGGEIKVLTKGGDILNTPWIDKFKDRDDFEVTDGYLGYDWAINALKNGKCVSRAGWNGKRMFVFQRPGDVIKSGDIQKIKSLPQSVKDYFQKEDEKEMPSEQGLTPIPFTPYLCMKAADGSIVNGWLASQTDMLATDWGLA